MADNNNIKEFTATDIEKYWSGQLSKAEMHDLERAAMDDPFLADALEGYANTTNVSDDIGSLKEKIDARVGATPVVNLKKKRVFWLRVAAAIIIIAGGGILLQQYIFEKHNERSLAVTPAEKSKDVEEVVGQSGALADTLGQQRTSGAVVKDSQTLQLTAPDSPNRIKKQESTFLSNDRFAATIKDDSSGGLSSVITKPAIREEKRGEESADRNVDKKAKTDTGGEVRAYYEVLNEKPTAAKAKAAENYSGVFSFYDSLRVPALSNSFNYRVVDAQNNPIPFAKVFNTRDNVGTYTDVKGNFNLLSSDTVMNVQVRSVGYNSANYKLVPSDKGNLVLKEDEETRKQITAQNRKLVTSVTRKDSAELEEPEVGWGNYNTYVANNIVVPDDIRTRNTTRSDVELSFEVDRNGRPTNIKITRSSQCKACDAEAIRLLRDGPKWKKRGKKNKTSISIAIDQ